MRLEKRKAILEIDLKSVFPLEIAGVADRGEFAFPKWGLERIERFHRRPSFTRLSLPLFAADSNHPTATSSRARSVPEVCRYCCEHERDAAGDRLSTKQKHNRPDVSCPRENLHAVIGRVRGVPVEQPFSQTFERTPQKQDYRGESDRDPQHEPVTESADEAKHRADPNRRGCR
jgi:hypothetical protein